MDQPHDGKFHVKHFRDIVRVNNFNSLESYHES